MADYSPGVAGYQNNAHDPSTDNSTDLFKALMQQTMGQQQNNPMSSMMPGLMALFQQMGGSNASWSPGVASANYSMGDE